MANLYDQLAIMQSESLLNTAKLMRDLGADTIVLKQLLKDLKSVGEFLPIEEATRAAEIRTEINVLQQEIRRLDQTANQSTFSDSISNRMNTAITTIKKMMTATTSIASSTLGKIKNIGSIAVTQIINGAKKSLTVFKNMIGSTSSIVKGAFGKLKVLGNLFPTGQIVNSIKRALTTVKTLTGNFGSSIKKLINGKRKSNSSQLKTENGEENDVQDNKPKQGNIISGALNKLIGATLNYGMANDKQNVKLAALVGSDKANEVDRGLVEYSTKSPYSKQSMMGNAVQLAQGGISAEAINPMMQNMGDIALGDEDKMSLFAEILARTNKEGSLTKDSLETLQAMGFDPLSEIANTTGKNINELYTDLQEGKIGIEDLTGAMQSATGEGGRFHNKAAELGKTLGGQLAMFTNKVNSAMEKLYVVIGPVVTKLVEFAGVVLDATVNGLGWFIDKIKEGDTLITLIAGTIGTLITALILYETCMTIASTATAIWGAIVALASSPLFIIILGIVAIIAFIGYMIYAFDGWGEAWDNTINMVQSIWSGCMNSIKYAWGSVYNTLMDGIDAVMIGWYKLKGLWDEEGASKEIAIIEKRSEERKAKLKETGEAAMQDFKNAGESFDKATNSIHFNGKGIGDMAKDLLPGEFSIAPPKNQYGQGTTKTDIGNSNVLTPGETKNITNSGTNHITINLQDLIGVLNINKEGFKESVNDMEEEVTDLLLRVLGTAVTAGSN